jgi:hypothetical protein
MSPKPQPTQSSLPTELHSHRQKFEQKPNTGALFKNTQKNGETDADYKGSVNVGGREFWLNGWINASRAGQKYLRLSLKLKAATAAASAEKPPFDDDLDISF